MTDKNKNRSWMAVTAVLVVGTAFCIGYPIITNKPGAAPRAFIQSGPPKNPNRFLVNNSIFLDRTSGATLEYARKWRQTGSTNIHLSVKLKSGWDSLQDEEAEGLWGLLIADATPVPPPGFEPEVPDPPVMIPRLEGPVVSIGSNGHPDSVVVLMVDRTELPPLKWVPSEQGGDVYILGMNPKVIWEITINGETKKLEVNERGYAWFFAKGETFEFSLRSTP